jgi:hypothetical protein
MRGGITAGPVLSKTHTTSISVTHRRFPRLLGGENQRCVGEVRGFVAREQLVCL